MQKQKPPRGNGSAAETTKTTGTNGNRSAEIPIIMTRVSAGLVEENRALDETIAQTNELSSSLKETATQADSVAVSGETMGSSINQIAASVEQVTANIAQVATAAAETTASVKQVSNRFSQSVPTRKRSRLPARKSRPP